MIKQFSEKISFIFKYDVYIIALGVFTIFPLLVISYFNQPSADDYCYAAKAQNLGFWNAQIDSYLGWTGRYLSTILLSFDILIKGKFILYKLFPIALVLLLFKSVFNLVSLTVVSISRKNRYVITSLFVATYFIQMPNISEGLFWYAGSVTYQLSNIISILLMCSLISLLRFKKVKHFFFAIVYVILLIGTNETAMIMWAVTLSFIFLYKIILDKKISYHLTLIITVVLIFSLIVILAPGNSVRGTFFPENHQFFNSIFQSLRALVINVVIWIPLLCFLTILLFSSLKGNLGVISSEILKASPVLVFLVVCMISFLGFFISFWSMGNAPPSRAVNVICFYFMLGFLYTMFLLFIKFEKETESLKLINKKTKYILMFIVMGSVISFNNIRGVYIDLLSGTAYRYNLELEERYQIIQNNTSMKLSIPSLKNKPVTLFVSDITEEATNWRNECYGGYFSEKVIVIKKED